MKRKVYYRYNPQTLTYERIYPSMKDKVFTVFRHLISGIVVGIGALIAFVYFFGTPWGEAQKKENQLILTQYEVLSKRADEMSKVLRDIQQRDDNLYRAIFHADPIPTSIRTSGVGAPGRYDYLTELSSPELIIQTTKKIDYISKQIYIQSNSFDEVLSMAKNQKDRLKHIPSIQPVPDKFLKQIASGYGTRIDPIYGTARFHAGMDFASNIGTPVYVTGDGVVTLADWKQGYGKCIIVDHGYGYETLYAHLNDYKVRYGQKVTRGEQIGEVGNTGKSTGPHLHYEVHVRGVPDNPAKYYFMDLSPEEYDKMLQIAANHGQVMD
ncbi:MAG: M23 family metallopeptidase [Dysgonomonas sp.]|uniref:M23 family metallopeptidase n=1 Tax=unclassified Dysgonomonas TaxID=2630389 RepID=UPI0025C6DC56|nr:MULTISPECIES: M23 family metallopeptidase [unclassified Dysgonomonas]MDR1717049.1 M23 family metallopeptidase [Prevotella sp.]MDR2002419.1 M23 family metallopeptidase [Prevotella sp.]HMM02897.1 M23 family metallopeptidase [Dysgonomonas sp.]